MDVGFGQIRALRPLFRGGERREFPNLNNFVPLVVPFLRSTRNWREERNLGGFEEALARAAREGDPYVEGLLAQGESIGEGRDLSFYEFHATELERCSLVRANLSKASFYDCILTSCDLSNAILSEAFLSRTRLVGCKLEGAQLNGAILRSASLVDCQCRYLNLGEAKLEGSTLRRCDLHEAFLSQVQLRRKSRLDECDLTKADLFRTTLSGIDLSSCNVEGIGLSADRSELRGAIVSIEQAPELAALLGVRFADFVR